MKGSNFSKILNIIIALIAIVGAVLFVRIFMEDTELIEDDVDLQNSVVSPLIYYSTFLFYLTVGVTILLSLISLFRNPDNLKKTLLGLSVLGVILIIAYTIADSNAVVDAQGIVIPGGEEGSSTNKWVGTGIMYSIILGAIAGFGFVVDLVKGLIK